MATWLDNNVQQLPVSRDTDHKQTLNDVHARSGADLMSIKLLGKNRREVLSVSNSGKEDGMPSDEK